MLAFHLSVEILLYFVERERPFAQDPVQRVGLLSERIRFEKKCGGSVKHTESTTPQMLGRNDVSSGECGRDLSESFN